ncbi:MAG TPA: hypothetical protein VGD40_10095 [Chryseosolibacter sp.]
MNKTSAVVIKQADGKYFAFAKQYPAAAVSAGNIQELFQRLRIALSDVIKQEEFDYKIEKMPA